MPHRVDFILETEHRRIQVPEQPVADRCLTFDQAFERSYIPFRTRNFPHHAQVGEAIPGHAVGGQHFRPAEEISLKIDEALLRAATNSWRVSTFSASRRPRHGPKRLIRSTRCAGVDNFMSTLIISAI